MRDFEETLIANLSGIAHEINLLGMVRKQELEYFKSYSELATKTDLKLLGEQIMSALSDWSAVLLPKIQSIGLGVDRAQALIEKLQNTPGAITPEDQLLLDQIQNEIEKIGNDVGTIPPIGEEPPVEVELGPDGLPLPSQPVVQVGADGKPLLGPDGKPLLVPAGSIQVVGPDGKPVIGPDGKPLMQVVTSGVAARRPSTLVAANAKKVAAGMPPASQKFGAKVVPDNQLG